MLLSIVLIENATRFLQSHTVINAPIIQLLYNTRLMLLKEYLKDAKKASQASLKSGNNSIVAQVRLYYCYTKCLVM